MIIVDAALEKREKEGQPIRVAWLAPASWGRGYCSPAPGSPTGMRLATISNRTVAKAQQALRDGGLDTFQTVTSTPNSMNMFIEERLRYRRSLALVRCRKY